MYFFSFLSKLIGSYNLGSKMWNDVMISMFRLLTSQNSVQYHSFYAKWMNLLELLLKCTAWRRKSLCIVEKHFEVVCVGGKSQVVTFCATIISTWCFRCNLLFRVQDGTIVCEIPGRKCKMYQPLLNSGELATEEETDNDSTFLFGCH